jgi:predicted DCC family thiol-disulfide oxidoreductase YuxK
MKGLPQHVTLIFDGRCGFCTRWVRLLRSLDRAGRVKAVPYQGPGTPEEHGLSLAQCEAAAWTVTPGPDRRSGAAAVNTALAVALGTRLPLWLYAAPGMEQLQERTYSLVARNRRRLPGDAPYCRQHPEGCR